MCDDAFVPMCLRMLRSYFRHNKTPIFVGSLGLKESNVKRIERAGATVLFSSTGDLPKHLCVCDLLTLDYVQQIAWTKIIWFDADIVHLQSTDNLFDLSSDYVGIPGRRAGGLIIKNEYGLHYAQGVWMCSSLDLLVEFRELLKSKPDLFFEGKEVSRIVNQGGYSHIQLDGDVYNCSREIVNKSRFDDDGKLFFYTENGRCYPVLIGLPRFDNESRDYYNQAILEAVNCPKLLL